MHIVDASCKKIKFVNKNHVLVQCLKLSQKCCRSLCLESQIINIKLKKNQQKVPGLLQSCRPRTGGPVGISNTVLVLLGAVHYRVTPGGGTPHETLVEIVDDDDKVIATKNSLSGTVMIPDARLWWPYTMNKDAAYQYTLKVGIGSQE